MKSYKKTHFNNFIAFISKDKKYAYIFIYIYEHFNIQYIIKF